MTWSATGCLLANSLWQISSAVEAKRFDQATENCSMAQEKYLSRLLHMNRDCAYGRRYNFAALDTIKRYQKTVPVTEYDDYKEYIERIAAGEEGVLTAEPVVMFEPSSGSASARKLIPYTRSLRKEFQTALKPWIAGTFSANPGVKKGKAYWSISPSLVQRRMHGGIPVGFDSDASYLGMLSQKLFAQSSVQPDMSGLQDMDTFRARTLAALFACEELTLISVWSPSFLRLLLKWGEENLDRVLALIDLRKADIAQDRLARIRRSGKTPEDYREIWPHLQLVSCWTDGNSRLEYERLRKVFPETHFQGKGLIATEAFVSLPYGGAGEKVLAVRSHFFEFLSDEGEVFLAHELERGKAYEVVVTTGGGLYRYRLRDRVDVTGFVGTAPTFRFVGKMDGVSDFYGEKVSAIHVSEIIGSMFDAEPLRFGMLAPDDAGGQMGYTLYVESSATLSPEIEGSLESRLAENPNYGYCVELGQLRPARIFRVEEDAAAVYESRMLGRRVKAGDVKLPALSELAGWSDCFVGEYL